MIPTASLLETCWAVMPGSSLVVYFMMLFGV
jgi:hypothetical protein